MKQLFGLIGKRLGHSYSRDWFLQLFSRLDIDADYLLMEAVEVSMIPEIIRKYPGLKGFNVTIPYKQEILAFCDVLSEEVIKTGAANCIRIKSDGLYAFNTDVDGFKALLGQIPEWRSLPGAMILGTGGAARAVRYVFSDAGMPSIMVTRGTKSSGIIRYDEIDASMLRSFPLLVNCTPAGMWPEVQTLPPTPFALFSGREILVDLVYNPAETEWMKMGRRSGCLTINGLKMLQRQAERSWEIWSSAE
jgi:shikimate dehydrogenase